MSVRVVSAQMSGAAVLQPKAVGRRVAAEAQTTVVHGHHGPNVGHHKAPANGPHRTQHINADAPMHAVAYGPVAAHAPVAVRRAHRGGHHHHRGTTHHAVAPSAAGAAGLHTNVTSKIGALAPPPSGSEGLNGGAIAGIVIAVLAVFAVVGFAVFRFVKNRKHMDPCLPLGTNSRTGYFRQGKGGVVSFPHMADEADTFDQDFKHWVEVVGSASNKQPFTQAELNKKPLSRIPSGSEPLGSTDSGTLVFKDMDKGATRGSSIKGTEILSEPVSPLSAPPGFPSGHSFVQVPPLNLER